MGCRRRRDGIGASRIDITEPLRRLGFAEYEAKAYVTLLRRSPLSGYKLAKLSGVPRADIFAVLQKLEERGAVLRLDVEAGTRYAPVPAKDVMQRLQARFQQTVEITRRSLEEVSAPPEREYVWNARGYSVLLDHARAFIDAAEQQLLLALSFPEAEALAEGLARAAEREVAITTLCLDACPHECGRCRGRIHRYRLGSQNGARWLVIVPDQREVLAGTIGGEAETIVVRTRQPLLAGLASRFILHSVALATAIGDLSEAAERLLQPGTRALMTSLGFIKLSPLAGGDEAAPPSKPGGTMGE